MRRGLTVLCLVAAVTGWVGYAILARPCSVWIAAHWGSQIVRLGDGKFTDAADFLQHRFYEVAWLATVSVVLLAAAVLAGGFVARKLPPLWKWVPYSGTGFVAVNLWLKVAMATSLFWCLFWNGKGSTDNLAQFQIKRLLLGEAKAPVKVALAGSSQVHVQIDHRQLNRELGQRFYVADLGFPSTRAYDFLLLEEGLTAQKPQVIVCYLSELNFFDTALSDGFPLFFSCKDAPQFLRLGGKPSWSWQKFSFGLLGDILPVFRLRDLFAERLLGNELADLRQRERNAALGTDLEQRAREAAPGFQEDAQSRFCMDAFERFVANCRAKRWKVVLCCGQLNPILERKLAPTLRPKMLSFLNILASKYDNVIVVAEQQLPAQSEQDYEDLTHVGPPARIRFTTAVAGILDKLRLEQ